MVEKVYTTRSGEIHYWTNRVEDTSFALVFLPGLTADHRLFDKQVQHFKHAVKIITWDAPAHASSWPFTLDFDLKDTAQWLNAILLAEDVQSPIIIGQSMGGYVGQMYSQLFPKHIAGFIAIDSAPLQRKYVTAAEIWLLKRMLPVYRYCPWSLLLNSGVNGAATTKYGREIMRLMMMTYANDKERYAQISAHGMEMLANAMEANLPYKIDCPALLICGKKDKSGSAIRYNKAWHKQTGIPIEWIEGAGHNSNTDAPQKINQIIADFIQRRVKKQNF